MAKASQKCANCNTVVNTSQKFCSRSCAATYNNKLHPKRKPEGKCHSCGVSISTKKNQCEKCKSSEVEKMFRKHQNIHTFQGPHGIFDRKLPSISYRNQYVFSCFSFKKLNNETKCEELVDYLLSLLTKEPDYVLKSDIRWLSAMLVHLLEADINCKYLPNGMASSIAKVPVTHIDNYLEEWIWSFFKQDYHPLIPSFALATCQFIDKHLFGYRSEQANDNKIAWKIEPWLEGDFNTNFYSKRIRFLDDPTFKKNFTERTGHLYVSCKLPENTTLKIPAPASKKIDVHGSANFDLNVTRCYLSQRPSDPYSIFCNVQSLNEAPFDIFEDAKFTGYILQIQNMEVGKHVDIEAHIPIRWAIGIKPHNLDDPILSLPQWLIE